MGNDINPHTNIQYAMYYIAWQFMLLNQPWHNCRVAYSLASAQDRHIDKKRHP